MKKTMSVLALGLALSLGGALTAQTATQQPVRPEGGERGARGPGRGGHGGESKLFEGITLSTDQQARLKALRDADRKEMEARREQLRSSGAQARPARGDTAAMKQFRAQHEQERARRTAAVRAILTPEQQRRFDSNLAELKQHEAQRDSARTKDGRGARHGGRQSTDR